MNGEAGSCQLELLAGAQPDRFLFEAFDDPGQRREQMNIREVIGAINQMEAAGVIDRYAIGGAVGAMFYLEPIATLDVVVFVHFQPVSGTLLLSPQPLFDYLTARGGVMDGEYVVVGGWPVQFLPSTARLVDEALDQAIEKDIEGTRARVFTVEHLAAIALQTGRPKDKARLLQFIESGAMDAQRLDEIIVRHDLQTVWQRFQRQFFEDAP